MVLLFSTICKALKNNFFLFIFFFIVQFSSFLVFSNPYLEDNPIEETLTTKPSWTCELDYDCLSYLQSELNKENDSSVYQACQYEYDRVKTCCESLDNCPSHYGVDRDLENIKSNLLNSAGNQAGCSAENMSNLIANIAGIQKKVCELGAKTCKSKCEDRLGHLKRRIKSCFSISSSIDKALKQANSSKGNTVCYKELKEIADKYKRQSRTGRSELREDLSSQDIVDCEGLKNKGNTAVGAKKAMEICSQVNQELLQKKQAEQKEKEEEERLEREEAKKAEEEERQRERVEEEKRLADERQKREIAEYAEELDKSAVEKEKRIEDHKVFMKERFGRDLEKEELESEEVKSEAEKEKAQGVKNIKQAESSKAGAVALTGAVTGTGSEEKTPANSHKMTSQSKKDKKPANKKTEAPEAKASPKEQSNQAQFSEKASISSLAGNTEGTDQCPAMPEITSQVVYQSVEAPQIEPLNEETDPYNNYDLVANKPAVILVSLKPPKNINDKKEYKISLKVNDQEIETECSKKFHKIEIIKEDNDFSFSKRKCKLRNRHFRAVIKQVKKRKEYQQYIKESDIHNSYIFIPIPTKYKGSKRSINRKLFIVITNPENPACISTKKDISVTIRKTSPLHLDFINLTYNSNHFILPYGRNDPPKIDSNKYCQENNIEVSDYSIINKFANSKEVNEYLPMMYPIGERQLSAIADNQNFIFGTCNNKYYADTNTTIGLISDVQRANLLTELNYISQSDIDVIDDPLYRTQKGFSILNRKLVVIVSENYMQYHKSSNTSGFVLIPKTIAGKLEGSWNVAFVSEKSFEDKLARGKDKAQGIVLHEIAHLLGQGKEYYPKVYKTGPKKDKPLPDNQQKYWCQKFLYSKKKPCHTYKIFGGLMASFKNKEWKFVNEKFPFMNNATDTLDNIGIDRETYQKLFQTFHHKYLDPTKSERQAQILKRTAVVLLSGLYDKKKGKFYNSFSMIHKKGRPSFSSKTGEIEVRLIRRIKTNNSIKYQTLAKVNPITKMNMELIFKKGGGQSIDLDLVPITVQLPISSHYLTNKKLRKDLRLIVRENFYTMRPMKKKNPYLHNVSLGGSTQSVSKKRNVLYNAPIDWKAKPEDFFIRKRR